MFSALFALSNNATKNGDLFLEFIGALPPQLLETRLELGVRVSEVTLKVVVQLAGRGGEDGNGESVEMA